METFARRLLGYGAVFFVVTSLTIFWTRFNGGLAFVWPGTAISCALFLAIPYRQWPAGALVLIVLSAIATSLFGFGPKLAIPLGVINVFEAAVAASLLRRARPEGDWIESEAGIVALALIGGLVAPLLASIPGGAVAAILVGEPWLAHASSWFAGHALGTVLFLPIVLLLKPGNDAAGFRPPTLRAAVEWLALIAVTIVVTAIALFQSTYPSLFLPILPLVLVSYRFGRFGASSAVLTITLLATVSLAAGTGPLAEIAVPISHKVLFLQFYLAVLLLISLPLSVALKQREILLAEIVDREALHRLIADHSDDALLHLDRTGHIRFASPAWRRLSALGEVEGRHLSAFFGQHDHDRIVAVLDDARDRPGSTVILERAVTRDSKTLWLEAKMRAVATGSSPVNSFVVTIRDVTARKLEELQAAHEARTDVLTGLPNRRAFLDVIERALTNADTQPFALALIDLDHFKRVNDTYGHDTGDIVLRQVATAMEAVASRQCFFARLGGEEFGLIMTGEAADGAHILCETLRHSLQRSVMIAKDGRTFNITASIGIARIAERCSASMALHAADGPLYAAKASGRNAVRLAHREGNWTGKARDTERRAYAV